MHRFFVVGKDISKDFIISDKKEIHHALEVLRLKEKDKIIAFDGKGNEIFGIIRVISRDGIEVVPAQVLKRLEKAELNLALACAIPKNSRFDDIVEKTTELGISTIIPLMTKRTEIRLTKEKQTSKVMRWMKIAVSSAKQSRRAILPEIREIKTFKEVLNDFADYDLVLLPCLVGGRKAIREILQENRAKNILVLIGPEGDFAPDEIDSAIRKGAKPVTLGKTVLRVDTAVIFAVSAIKAILEDGLNNET